MNRSVAFIFNSFEDNESSCPHDRSLLINVLKDHEFDVTYFMINTVVEFIKTLRKVASDNYSKNTSLWIFVIAPGSQGRIRIGDMFLPVDFLYQSFSDEKCPSLMNKPKIFAIQTSGGEEYIAQQNVLDLLDLTKDASFDVKIPIQRDFFVFYSSFAANCSKDDNTCFIQAFCNKLRLAENVEIMELFTYVIQKIINKNTDYCTGVPVVMSTLQQKLFLK